MFKKIGIALCLASAFGCSAISNAFTSASPLPSEANMSADCTKNPGSLSCDLDNVLTQLCNGDIAIPITSGNIDQAVCDGLGYRTIAGTSLKIVVH